MDRQADNSAKITFFCPTCGRRLTMPQSCVGKRGRCPKCKQMVTVPAASAGTTATASPGDADATAGKSPLYDLRLLDLPPADADSTMSAEPSEAETAYEQFQAMQGGRLPGLETETPRRRLPWIIDIFLYPMNKAGISILLITIGIPFLVRLTTRFFFFAMASFGPLFIFWVLFIVLQWAVLAFALLYANWYFCECIRDSIEGGIRAADTAANTPGLGEIVGQAIKVVASVVVCVGPALIYHSYTDGADGVFWILYATGGFFVPIAVLAMTVYDTWRALNPLLLLGSILKTPFQYCALVAFGYLSCFLVLVTGRCLTTPETWVQGFVLLFVTLYQLLILAHLLGRFYWRNEEKLSWDA